ncbi:pteridine reductase [Methylococcus geothermalis]|uniref:Pteridine reductase n=1 Tax=Methylococcus geothermalis TaxID=2681310 RepID=A0A858Q5J2_9GAMM|nr:pteridine reductase [Methylococcus geothermalis]QJD29075.1 pteridine reductase [Methylococcus geothermalis]
MKEPPGPAAEKVALITGAARRVGATIAAHLHGQGYRVVVHYHRSEADALMLCESLNQRRSDSAAAIGANLLDLEALAPLIETAATRWGRLDVLINNASVFYPTPLGSVTGRQWDELLGSNLRAPFFLVQHAIPWLSAARGCVVNLADIHADRPLRNHAAYSITKAGLVAMTKALAKELAPAIRVNAVAPGAILWPEQGADAAIQAEILNRIPLGRPGEPLDIARAVAYLADQAPYVTGQVLAVDGGRSLFG